MLDLKWIVDNPGLFDEAMEKRNSDFRAKRIIELDTARREKLTEIENLRHERNDLSKTVGVLRSKGENTEQLEKKSEQIGGTIIVLENSLKNDMEAKLNVILALIPNLPQNSVPVGKDEVQNVVLRTWGEPTKFNFQPKPHYELGEDLGQMDFKQTGEICGSRYTSLFGGLARLERALSNFFLDFVKKHGFQETSIPFLVRPEAMFGTGNLPKFAEDSYCTKEGMWLIPTSEVSMTNWVAGRIVEERDLPIRLTAYTPCWRSEAGSAGKDTRGMLRQHQFKKVEMVAVTTPEQSSEEHERMKEIESELLIALKLPFRVVLLCSGDMGFASSKTYDHEVWLPAQNTYREISSCSNCTDFQTRRMNARYRSSSGKLHFLHSLNGSALALGRTIIAIMENYQRRDGSIEVPIAIIPYMNGESIIAKEDGVFI
ncbi:MAG: serine--tRNA ligase [Rickettsiales bacterium]|jgi:seryl-tRNA synthetase|nr:serine--tRNA ligase [Rickettsiales bacterium]